MNRTTLLWIAAAVVLIWWWRKSQSGSDLKAAKAGIQNNTTVV